MSECFLFPFYYISAVNDARNDAHLLECAFRCEREPAHVCVSAVTSLYLSCLHLLCQ